MYMSLGLVLPNQSIVKIIIAVAIQTLCLVFNTCVFTVENHRANCIILYTHHLFEGDVEWN